MSDTHLKPLCEQTLSRLKKASMELERFLNQTTLASLVEQSGDPDEYEEYYRSFLSDLRHLSVYSELACEKLGVCLRRARFDQEFAEEVLHRVYRTCINQFFYPKGEVYDEDGRYCFTGDDAVCFKKKVTPELRQLMLTLYNLFAVMRDDLVYYESDYLAKKQAANS